MDRLTPERRSANMKSIRARNTRPEVLVRKQLHRLGYRFRLHAAELPGRPDIVFRPRRKAIFVHGCFWHRHKDCRKAYSPKSNITFWEAKFARNQERDLETYGRLRRLGWQLHIVWECELADGEHLKNELMRFLGPTGKDGAVDD